MKDVPKHSQAKMYPSELATLGILFALKGKGCRALKQQRVHLCRASFLAGKSLNLGAAGQCLRDPRRPRWLIANNLKYTPTDPLD